MLNTVADKSSRSGVFAHSCYLMHNIHREIYHLYMLINYHQYVEGQSCQSSKMCAIFLCPPLESRANYVSTAVVGILNRGVNYHEIDKCPIPNKCVHCECIFAPINYYYHYKSSIFFYKRLANRSTLSG